MSDLFTTRQEFAQRAPLARRMRPAALEDLLGQEHLTAPGKPLHTLLFTLSGGGLGSAPSSVILYGPPGSGKTTVARVIASAAGGGFVELSAMSSGIKDIREAVASGKNRLAQHGDRTVLFVDEVHRFSKTQQDALLPAVEEGHVVLVAATTENPNFAVVRALLSRSLVLPLRALDASDTEALVRRAVDDDRGLGGAVEVTDEAVAAIVQVGGGDARQALTLLEACAASVQAAAAHRATADSGDSSTSHDPQPPAAGPPQVTAQVVESIAENYRVAYDAGGDRHYDVTSALIKSVRGSDVDAALHYLAVMLDGGEDVQFICRRLMILAAEDVGLGDPTALTLATSCHHAVINIGMPEARIILAQTVTYLALAPKSNSAYLAIDEALADVRAGRGKEVPAHLRDAHYKGADELGHGSGYRYAHDATNHVAAQQYLPDDLLERRYYRPGALGVEGRWQDRWESLRAAIHRDD